MLEVVVKKISMGRLHAENICKHVLTLALLAILFPGLKAALLATSRMTGDNALSGIAALAAIQVTAIIPFYSYSFAITDPRKLLSRLQGYCVTGFYLFVILFTMSGMIVIVEAFGDVAVYIRFALCLAAIACILFDIQDFFKVGQDLYAKEFFVKESEP